MNFLTSSEKIERIFEKYFQKMISLSVKDESIKKGKFLLIKNCVVGNNYFFELIIERSKKLDSIKIPYPFNIEEYPEENLLFMDYRISTLCNNDKSLIDSIHQWMEVVDVKTPNKLIDSILEIKFE